MQAISQRKVDLDADALTWLISSVSDNDAVTVGIQAMGAVHCSSLLAHGLRRRVRVDTTTYKIALERCKSGQNPLDITRLSRSRMCIEPGRCGWDTSIFSPSGSSAATALMGAQYPDMSIISHSLSLLGADPWLPYHHASAWEGKSPSLTSTCILLIGTSGFSRRCIVTLLMFCDLMVLSQADWNLIAAQLRSCAGGPCPSLPHRLCHTSTCMLWLADYVACLIAGFPDDDDDEYSTHAAAFIGRLLIVACGSIQNLVLTALDIENMPYLSAYLGSAEFRHISHSDDELNAIVQMLWLRSNEYMPGISLLRLFRIVPNILGAATANNHLNPWWLDGIVTICARMFRLNSEGCIDAAADVQDVVSTLTYILRPVAGNGVSVLRWLLDIGFSPGSTTFMLRLQALFRATAVGLGFVSRARADSDDLVQGLTSEFFNLMRDNSMIYSLVTLLFFPPDQERDYSTADRAVVKADLHYVQHCIELRPAWWLQTLVRARHAVDTRREFESQEGVQWYVSSLDAMAARHGPCRKCPGVPLGWELEHVEPHTDSAGGPHPCQ
ncbi:hypothetical protein EXIGLDRAFT_135851 [Exidia glandulosa HHB12029]|uniref:Uncharacterized protein n=1 Tax=Exidia glandulosa HHB12029 TaxID=1314781 RepID=A0A165NGR7_EXIGL|nr:hypothetical protein EXIGLDRAFT_135851 [Exidia glandulosa HHB12029]